MESKQRKLDLFFLVMLIGVISTSSGSAAIYNYEMNVPPDQEPVPMIKSGNGFGDVAAGDFPPTGDAGIVGDGTANIMDSGPNGYDGYHINGLGDTYTVDIRIRSDAYVQPRPTSNDIRSMGIHDGNNGRGVLIDPDGLRFVNGSGGVQGTALVDLSTMHMIRIVVDDLVDNTTGLPPADGVGEAYVYDLETTPGAWTLLAGPIGLGGSGCGSQVSDAGTGGTHINSLAGSTTTLSDYALDWFRIDSGTNRGATGDIIPMNLTAVCQSYIAPDSVLATPHAFQNEAADPSPIIYAVLNNGTTSLNYSVAEVDTVGDALDHTWLSLDKSGGTINSGDNDAVQASITDTSMAEGTYTAYVKFSDDSCSAAMTCFSEEFSYTHGTALVGNDGWSGDATASDIVIDNGVIKYDGGAAQVYASHDISCSGSAGAVVSVSMKVLAGSGGTVWIAEIVDTSGYSFGRFYGTGTTVRGRIDGDIGEDLITDEYALTGGSTWDTLTMKIYPASNKTACYFNGSLMVHQGGDPGWEDDDGILDHTVTGANDQVSRIELRRVENTIAGTDYAYLDDLSVSVEPETLRRIDLTITACSIRVQEPRIRYLGACDGTISQEVFTVKNEGAYDWTGFDAYDFTGGTTWLSLDFTSAAVARGDTATVTANIDWSLVPVGDSHVDIRFRATCDGGSTWVADTPSVDGTIKTLNVTKGAPIIVEYLGDVDPDTIDSGGPGYTFVLLEGVKQGSVVSDLQADNNAAWHIPDSDIAKTKWRSTSIPIGSGTGATVLARVKCTAEGGTDGGNLFINESASIACSYHWGGPTGHVREVNRGNEVTITGDSDYHILRMTATGPTEESRIITLYMDENPTPVLEITNASAHTVSTESLGFGAGSTSGTQDIYFDWVTGTNSGAFAPGEEDGCLGRSLIPETCRDPFADVDGDQDVDQDDFAMFQVCYTGSGASTIPQGCSCFDREPDGDIDESDFAKFQACASGPNVTANIACDD